MRFRAVLLAALATVGMAAQAVADDGYVTIEGAKQGKFKGEGLSPKQADKTQALSAEFGYSQPATAGTPVPGPLRVGGARPVREPVTFTFRLGPATPQLFQAAVTNETLKSVLYEVIGTSPEGDQEITNTIRLTNARITSFKLVDRNGPEPGVDHLVMVAFAYGQIEIENKAAKVMATDTWPQS